MSSGVCVCLHLGFVLLQYLSAQGIIWKGKWHFMEMQMDCSSTRLQNILFFNILDQSGAGPSSRIQHIYPDTLTCILMCESDYKSGARLLITECYWVGICSIIPPANGERGCVEQSWEV